ncbi:class A sortase [Enterococcus hirae]|nr:class A sortase [Enterococcus hirae]EMF0536479.1 class A sortase [Enterococcus hirae]
MKKKKRSVFRVVINSFLCLLFVIGAALIFMNPIKDYLIKQTGESYAVDAIDRSEIEKNKNVETTFDFDAVEPVSVEAILKAQFSHKALPVIGGIAIPSVGINLPIFKGLSNEALLYGAGTVSPTQKMGEDNYALASHRTENLALLFTPLDQVELGAMIYLTDLENVYVYTATSSVRVDPTAVYLLDEVENRKIITLITCGEIGGVTRRVVQGDLVSVTPIDKATNEMLEAFGMEQQTLG